MIAATYTSSQERQVLRLFIAHNLQESPLSLRRIDLTSKPVEVFRPTQKVIEESLKGCTYGVSTPTNRRCCRRLNLHVIVMRLWILLLRTQPPAEHVIAGDGLPVCRSNCTPRCIENVLRG